MNESDLRDLERRLAASLHALAPHADPDLSDRLLGRTAALEQRRGFFGLSLSRALAVRPRRVRQGKGRKARRPRM